MKRVGTAKWKFGNSTEFVAVSSARSSEIQIKTYRCPINEIFSALFIRRDARFGRKRPRTRNISPFSVHAWFHLTLITSDLRHRNLICRWTVSSYVNESRRVVKVFAAVHSLIIPSTFDIGIGIECVPSEIKSTPAMEISPLSSSLASFHYNCSKSNSNAVKSAQFIRARKLSFSRFLTTTMLCWLQSAQIVLQFNYIIDDRWRLWLYRKWKHDIIRLYAARISWQRRTKQQRTTRPSVEAQRSRRRKKRERNEFEKCERVRGNYE